MGLAKWWNTRRVNQLLVKRAELIAVIAAEQKIREIDPCNYGKLAGVEERLRQLDGRAGHGSE